MTSAKITVLGKFCSPGERNAPKTAITEGCGQP
jgi:hypothetical protein